MLERNLFLLIAALIILAMPHFARAEDAVPVGEDFELTEDSDIEPEISFEDAFRDLNRTNPKKNSKYKRGSRLLTRHVLDKNGKSLGNIQDITLERNGNVSAIISDMKRVKLSGPDLALNHDTLDLQGTDRGYHFGQTHKEVKDLYPQLLADIATAAGSSGLLSTKKLIGASIKDENGRRFGKVEDILFDQTGSQAEALLIRVNYKSVRSKSVAVPIDTPNYIETRDRPKISVTETQAAEILKFAR